MNATFRRRCHGRSRCYQLFLGQIELEEASATVALSYLVFVACSRPARISLARDSEKSRELAKVVFTELFFRDYVSNFEECDGFIE